MSNKISVRRLNHAVLYVSDLERSVDFYEQVFGFAVIARQGPMAFMRAKDSTNHHDLGLLSLGKDATRAPEGSTGLYHLAWELGSVKELAAAREELRKAGAYTGESDHGATKSVYGVDPDGNEFELIVLLPRDKWGAWEHDVTTKHLDWDRELKR